MLISVHSKQPVANVCQQELRELLHIDETASLAHVIMQPGSASLLHRHETLTETYYILSGKGEITIGERTRPVQTDDLILVPPHAPHRLRNTGETELIHLVFCVPKFDPSDVLLLETTANDFPSDW